MTDPYDPIEDPQFAEPDADPAEEDDAGWGDELYDRLHNIVDDEGRSLLSTSAAPLINRQRLVMIAGLVLIAAVLWLAMRALMAPSALPEGPEAGPAAPPTPTATPVLAEAGPPTPTPTLTPTLTPTPPPGIQVGSRVRVIISDGSGMRFRSGPGLDYLTLAIVPDGTEFKVVGGPTETDGIVWWRLEAEDGTVGYGADEALELVGE